jgi:hypothetical protein
VIRMGQDSGLKDDRQICKEESPLAFLRTPDPFIRACILPKGSGKGKVVLLAVIRFLSLFFSNTDSRSRT